MPSRDPYTPQAAAAAAAVVVVVSVLVGKSGTTNQCLKEGSVPGLSSNEAVPPKQRQLQRLAGFAELSPLQLPTHSYSCTACHLAGGAHLRGPYLPLSSGARGVAMLLLQKGSPTV